jgi:hypothetical protein
MTMKGGSAMVHLGLGAMLVALATLTGTAVACTLDAAPTSRWRTAQENGVEWLITPCGERFFAAGVNVLDGGASAERLNRPHYDWRATAPTLDDWIAATRRRLADWGFNSAGAWSLPPQQLKLPTVINLELGRIAKFHWFDPFDPAMPQRMKEAAERLTAPYRGSPYRIGYFADNEVGWWSGALFLFYGQKPAGNFTKQRWVAFLRESYGEDWRRFTEDFAPPDGVRSWDDLLRSEQRTRLRPGGSGSGVVRRWTGIVAERYYRLAADAIHAADPDALFLGDRLPIYYDPVAIRAEAPYVDAIASNYNVDSPEGWVAPYYFDGLRALSGGKPVLISEWFYAARENRTGNRNNGHLMTVDTQAERAAGAAAAAANFAAVPEILGTDWFQYYDYPVGGRADAEDYNFGLVDIRDRPYEELAAALGAANRRLPAIHAAAAPMPRQHGEIMAPEAAIDPAHLSLVDWPKPASLLPPLVPEPDEVAFGEAYLSWSDKGLAVATIGQDYFDSNLLADNGDFPLREAYRLEFGADAGAGPHRFTLFLVPTGPMRNGHQLLKALLCSGDAAAAAEGCSTPDGGEALFFGADQPRIVAEALLPWSALGVAAPPADRRIRFDLSATAWYRSRWMSLSGTPPGRRDDAIWTHVRLAATPQL